jgi:uncharacterized protein YfcZ (UPF0381/DUF406 family)
MGIFFSRCKTTKKLDSVTLLSKPATDKNLFYISTFAWVVETFQHSVNPDFSTLEDGLTLYAAMTCVCNAELIVYALVSGALLAQEMGPSTLQLPWRPGSPL